MKVHVKVFINSEADLPKEEGYYFVMLHDDYDRPLDIYHWYETNNAQCKQEWLTYVNYWLKEVELAELIEMPSDDEIEDMDFGYSYSSLLRKEGAIILREEILKRNK